MAKAETAVIAVARTSGGTVQEMAEIHGPLAIHQDFLFATWSVTHIQTGYSVGPPLLSKRRALTLVSKLRKPPIGDAYWLAIKKPNDVRKKQFAAQRAAVRALIGPGAR